MKNLAPLLADENDTVNLGNVNHEALSSPELETPAQLGPQRKETKSPELELTNKLKNDQQVSSDEWWNYVDDMVKKDEGRESENNNNKDIIQAR